MTRPEREFGSVGKRIAFLSVGCRAGKFPGPVILAALVFCFAVSFANVGTASQHQPPPRAPLVLSIDDGRLSLDVQEVPIENVLRAIAHKGEFTLDVIGSLQGAVSDSFNGLPLDRAIRRLLYRATYIIELDPQESTASEHGIRRLLVVGRKIGLDRGSAALKPKQQTAEAGRTVSKVRARQAKLTEVQRLGRNRTEPAIQKLLGLLQNDGDPVVRSTVAKILARFSRKPVVGALIAALGDPAVRVRRRAIVSLGKIGGDQAVRKVIGILGSREDWQNQVLAAQVLSRHRTPLARQGLAEVADLADLRVTIRSVSSLISHNRCLGQIYTKDFQQRFV